MKRNVLVTSLLLSMGSAAWADSTQDEIALLKEQLKMLTQKIEKLEAKSNETEAEVKKVAEAKTEEKASWADRITFSGDFRYREEYIDQRGRETRNRHRARLRLAAKAQVNDRLDVNFRLATGVDNPASANQTLDGSFTTKDFGLDRAYFNYKLTDALTLTGGKMANPAYKAGKNQMLWDNDVNPEGLALQLDVDGWKGNLVGYAVEEFSGDDDILLFGGQLNKTMDLGNGELIAGVSYYDYQNLQGAFPLYDGRPRNSSVDANGRLINDYNIFEGSLEYQTKLADQPFSVFGSYVENTEADDLESGYAYGASIGKVSKPGSWSFSYTYMDIDADAVIGIFNDSNFGAGAPDSKGHLLRGGYGLYKNTSLAMAYFSNELNKDSDTPVDYDRLQLDFILKFK
jgi:cell division protein FtsB